MSTSLKATLSICRTSMISIFSFLSSFELSIINAISLDSDSIDALLHPFSAAHICSQIFQSSSTLLDRFHLISVVGQCNSFQIRNDSTCFIQHKKTSGGRKDARIEGEFQIDIITRSYFLFRLSSSPFPPYIVK